MIQQKKEKQSVALLSITSVIWGLAFVFQRTGMEHIGPFAFNFFRCVLSTMFLFILTFVLKFKKREDKQYEKMGKSSNRSLIIGGMFAGFALFLAMSTQQVGMIHTTASKAGFITTMYIIIVPVMGMFYGRKTTAKTWFCVALASVGLYLLSIKNGFEIGKGDFMVFLSAIFFGLQIVAIDVAAPKADAIKLSIVQFITSGVLSLIVTLMTETVTLQAVQSASIALLYTGVMSSGIGFTLQIVAQKNLPATITSLIMSTESAVSMFAGVIFLNEHLSGREIVGCVVMAVAIVLTQVNLPSKKKSDDITYKKAS